MGIRAGGRQVKGRGGEDFTVFDEDAPIFDSLKGKAPARGVSTDMMLQLYGRERTLWRMTQCWSPDHLMLKGSQLSFIDTGDVERPTHDIDMHFHRKQRDVKLLVEDALLTEFYDDKGAVRDGMNYQSIKWMKLEHSDEPGLRAKVTAFVGKTMVNLQIDFGFGGCPPHELIVKKYPTVLGDRFPAPYVSCQPTAYRVAEKLHAVIDKGMGNTRMKDFWDLRQFIRKGQFDVEEVAFAIERSWTEARPSALRPTASRMRSPPRPNTCGRHG